MGFEAWWKASVCELIPPDAATAAGAALDATVARSRGFHIEIGIWTPIVYKHLEKAHGWKSDGKKCLIWEGLKLKFKVASQLLWLVGQGRKRGELEPWWVVALKVPLLCRPNEWIRRGHHKQPFD